MEEKKTKKMTKAEAFEYFKGKKVHVNGKGKEVQTKLFECGVTWLAGDAEYHDYSDYLIIDISGLLSHCGTWKCESYWRSHCCEEISADDILSIEIVDEKKKSENVSIELEKWIGVIRDKFCCNHWSIVISASNFALFSGDLIEEKRIKE